MTRLRYNELAPEGLAALRRFEHYLNTATSLSPVLLELVRLRASQTNGCDFCVHAHTAELRKHHEPDSRINAVANWQSSEAFTPRERAALAWTETITLIPESHASDADYAAVTQFFHDKELVDLTLAVGSINLWNRLGVAFRPDWNPQEHTRKQQSSDAAQSAVGDDGGKVATD